MKLTAYVIDGHEIKLRRAPPQRSWMDAAPGGLAYQCLPLGIANAYGWEVLCPHAFKAQWDGEADAGSIRIECESATPQVGSYFGSAILTFLVPCVFRTELGYDLFVQGPLNRPKDALTPLSAIVETDWLPFSFTMSWMFTQPEVEVEFEEGEPFCHIFPIRRGEIETFEPEIRKLSSDPKLEASFLGWSGNRNRVNLGLPDQNAEEEGTERWQNVYRYGADWDFTSLAPRDHRTELELRDFKDLSET